MQQRFYQYQWVQRQDGSLIGFVGVRVNSSSAGKIKVAHFILVAVTAHKRHIVIRRYMRFWVTAYAVFN